MNACMFYVLKIFLNKLKSIIYYKYYMNQISSRLELCSDSIDLDVW